MMIDRPPTDDDLNAYVDGELSAHDRAQVAQAIAANPVLADRVATLSRLKSTFSGLADEPMLTLDSLNLAEPRRWLPTTRIAAAVLACFLIAGLGAGVYWGSSDTKATRWADQAKTQHLAWLGETTSSAVRDDFAGLLHKARQRLDLPAPIPDMSSAKLTLSDIAFVGSRDADASRPLQLRYTGQRGCRVSLWLSRGDSADNAAMTELDDGHSRGFYWTAGGINYALFASGMDHKRLTLLARNVFEATRDRQQPPIHHERELRVATESATPCRS